MKTARKVRNLSMYDQVEDEAQEEILIQHLLAANEVHQDLLPLD